MKTQFEQMMDGLNDVEAFLAGEQEGFKAHVPHDVDVKAIRNRLGMTQARFSDTFGFSLDAIKHWEGGRRTPEAPARTLLTVIARNPTAVLNALNPAAFAAAVGSSKPTPVRAKADGMRRNSRTRRKAHSASGKAAVEVPGGQPFATTAPSRFTNVDFYSLSAGKLTDKSLIRQLLANDAKLSRDTLAEFFCLPSQK